MAYGTLRGMFDHTWYKPAFRTERERACAAALKLARWYEKAMMAQDMHLTWLFDLECAFVVHRTTTGFREKHIQERV